MSKKKHTRESDEKSVPDQPAEEIVRSADPKPAEHGGSHPHPEGLHEKVEIGGGKSPEAIDIRSIGTIAVRNAEIEPAPFTEVPPLPKERVQAALAYVLMGILGGTILLHYVITTVIWFYTREPKDFEDHYKPIAQIFNTLLPILSGLVSSAIT